MPYQIHQLCGVTGVQMMSYVLRTPSGGTYVIDGGYDADADELVRYILEISGSNRVDGWFLTHPNNDHICALLNLLENKPDVLDIRKIYYNLPDERWLESCRKVNDEPETPERLARDLPLIGDRGIVVHDGDEFTEGDLSWKVLSEPDSRITANPNNNASVLYRFQLGSKSLLITGDIGVEGAQVVLACHRAELASDIVEMAHHGQNGAHREFYEAVRPSVCLWPTPGWLWDNDAGGGYDSHFWKTIVVRGWMSELGVRKHIAAKDGTQVLEVE